MKYDEAKISRLLCEVEGLLQSWEARKRLDQGFKGMGYNIVQETAGRFYGYLRTLDRLMREIRAEQDD